MQSAEVRPPGLARPTPGTGLPQIVVPTAYAGGEATPILGQTEDEGCYDFKQKRRQLDFNLRGVPHTGGGSLPLVRSLQNKFYPIPDGGPVGQLLEGLDGTRSDPQICATSSAPQVMARSRRTFSTPTFPIFTWTRPWA